MKYKELMRRNAGKQGQKWFDWAIFAFLGAVCFFCLQQGDILHTGGSSIAYLNGHILDFYEYNAPYMGMNNYLPSTYILFAVWNIPLRLLGWLTVPTNAVPVWVLMWYKLLPTLVYLLSGYMMYRIAVQIDMGAVKAKLCAYAFMTAPIAFFSQFMFGQYDIFTVFFMLFGLYYWCRRDLVRFALLFGIAITFKYFALLVFVPLLFLREKRLGRIFLAIGLALLPVVLEVIPYLSSSAFQTGVLGFGATGYIMATVLQTQISRISIIVVLWIGLCGYAFFRETADGNDEFRWAVFLASLVMYMAFGLSLWHPQWLLIAMPFLVFGMMLHKRPDVFCLIDVMMMLFFTVYTVNIWSNHVDQSLFGLGVLRSTVGDKINSALTMRELFVIRNTDLLFTCFSSMLLVSAWFKHPKYLDSDVSRLPEHGAAWLRGRFLVGVSVFLIPAFLCYFSAVRGPDPVVTHSSDVASHIGAVDSSYKVEQYVEINTERIERIDVMIGTYARVNQGTITVTVAQTDGKVIAEAHKQLSELTDNACAAFEFADTPVTAGEQYVIRVAVAEETDADFVTIYRTSDGTAGERSFARLDGIRQDYNLCIDVYGNKAA